MCKPILQNRAFPQIPAFVGKQQPNNYVQSYAPQYMQMDAYPQKAYQVEAYTPSVQILEDSKVEVNPDQFMDLWATVKDIAQASQEQTYESLPFNNEQQFSAAPVSSQDLKLEENFDLADLESADMSPLFDILLDDDVSNILTEFDVPEFDMNGFNACEAPITSPKPKSGHHKTCTFPGCTKFVRSRGLCKAHGGSLQCVIGGCGRQSQGNGLCIKHGGGRRCEIDGCARAAQSNHRCKKHGGGQRCSVEGCNKSSQGGGLCRSHGGGQRCGADGCRKGAQRDGYCAAHGGIRLCSVEGCSRNDRGGGRCAYHGGGKRCKVDNCVKPSRKHGLCAFHFRVEDDLVRNGYINGTASA